MKVNKLNICGKRGETVCYSIKDFNVDESAVSVSWNEFKFYTPAGEKKDSEGFDYFEVPSGNLSIQRDEKLDKIYLVIAEQGNSRALEILEGATMDPINMGLEGDIITVVSVPSDASQEISVDYKEVTDGN